MQKIQIEPKPLREIREIREKLSKLPKTEIERRLSSIRQRYKQIIVS